MKTFGVFFFTILIAAQGFAFPSAPNPEWGRGSLCTTRHEDYIEKRYEEKIAYCQRNVSSSLKKAIYNLYQIPEKCRDRYSIDHIIPLSIGGDNSPENLWPEHKKIKATRPTLELNLYYAIKNGKIKQHEAIQIIIREKFKKSLLTSSATKCDE